MARIADILIRAQKQYFTGREKEIDQFTELLKTKELSTNVLFLYGPAGQGKTTILKEFTLLCKSKDIPFAHLDGRDIISSTAGFYESLFQALQVSSVQKALNFFEKCDKKFVLFIDTYEKLNALDDWIRQEFLPQLPDNVLTVFSSRNQPSVKWLSDPGWQNLTKTIPIKNFSNTESKNYLQKRNVPDNQFEKILDFTHGHPLALCLVADLFSQNPGKIFSPDDSPNIVQTLLDNFLLKSPSPAHKTALEICALTYITTESLLASVMEMENASELFEWLKNLSFIESTKLGLYPHDLARESLVTDLKWRNPDWFVHLYNKAWNYYLNKLETASGEEQRRFLFKLTYLQRNHPAVRPFYNWEETHDYWVDLMKPEDVKVLTKMVTEFYGEESVKAFKFWINHPAAQVWVWRSPDNPHNGFVMRININEISAGEKVKDEVIHKIMDCANSEFHLRKGEVCTVFRFWMASETHQNISKIQSSIFLFITQYYLTTHDLAIHLISVAKPEFWKSLLNYYGMEHVPALDYLVNKIPRGFYMHDWRKSPPKLWLVSLGKGITQRSMIADINSKSKILMLSETEFTEAVYQALKDYYNEKKLQTNPLIHCRLVLKNQENGMSTDQRIAHLKEELDAALKKLAESPRYDNYHRLLYRTFINPVGSQEQIAEFLTLPFSTYRRHLKKSVNLVSEILWKQEIS